MSSLLPFQNVPRSFKSPRYGGKRPHGDPYNRLGMSSYASEEESIEAAFEKLLMSSFIKKKKVEESPSSVKTLLDFVEMPPMDAVFTRLFLFAFTGGWSIINSVEGGPAFSELVL